MPTLDLITGGDLAQRIPLDSLRQWEFACQPMPIVKPRLGLLTFILGVRHREHQISMHLSTEIMQISARGVNSR